MLAGLTLAKPPHGHHGKAHDTHSTAHPSAAHDTHGAAHMAPPPPSAPAVLMPMDIRGFSLEVQLMLRESGLAGGHQC